MARSSYVIIPFAMYAVIAVFMIIFSQTNVSVIQENVLPGDIDYGVSAHNVSDTDISMMVDAHFSWIRIDTGPGFVEVAEKANAAGLHVLGILHLPSGDFTNVSNWE